jgi:hypothetical protein
MPTAPLPELRIESYPMRTCAIGLAGQGSLAALLDDFLYARRRSTVCEMSCTRLVNECDRELVPPIDGLWGRASSGLRLVVQSGTGRQFPLMTVLQSL